MGNLIVDCCSKQNQNNDEMKEEINAVFEKIKSDNNNNNYIKNNNNNNNILSFKNYNSYLSITNSNLLTSNGLNKSTDKIIFEIKENPLEDYSKTIFQRLNELRTTPENFYSNSKKFKLDNIIEKYMNNKLKPNLLSWSTKKINIINNIFTNNKYDLFYKKINEIKNLYETDFILDLFYSKGNINNIDNILFNVLKNYNEIDIEKFMNIDYNYCVIYSEIQEENIEKIKKDDILQNIYNFKDVNNEEKKENKNNNEENIFSFFFFFKLL